MQRFYLLQLNDSRSGIGPVRFAAYRETPNGLAVVWPDSPYVSGETDAQRTRRSKADAAKIGMAYSRSDKYPAFHYVRSGCGYSKAQCIAEDISRLVCPGEPCEVYTLSGWAPSKVGTFKDGKYAEGGAA